MCTTQHQAMLDINMLGPADDDDANLETNIDANPDANGADGDHTQLA